MKTNRTINALMTKIARLQSTKVENLGDYEADLLELVERLQNELAEIQEAEEAPARGRGRGKVPVGRKVRPEPTEVSIEDYPNLFKLITRLKMVPKADIGSVLGMINEDRLLKAENVLAEDPSLIKDYVEFVDKEAEDVASDFTELTVEWYADNKALRPLKIFGGSLARAIAKFNKANAVEEEEEPAPAPRGRGRAKPEPAPARGRGRKVVEEADEEDEPAPVKRGRAKPEAEEDDEPTPAPRKGRAKAASLEDEDLDFAD